MRSLADSGHRRRRPGSSIVAFFGQKLDAPVSFLGRVADEDLPLLYGAGDLFAMLCRNRWWGLEQEGFGIVFLEAAACGVAQVAGRSGGSHEAVLDGETGVVVDDPEDVTDVAMVIADLLNNEDLRVLMGAASGGNGPSDTLPMMFSLIP